jgi:hypothetical protein
MQADAHPALIAGGLEGRPGGRLRMGSAFRGALIAGLRTDAVELVPSVPRMFGWYYAARPPSGKSAGRVIIAVAEPPS